MGDANVTETSVIVGEDNYRTTKKEGVMERMKPYMLCVVVSFLYAAFTIVSKICLDKGMSRYVLVAYGYAVGAITCAVLALLFERKNKAKVTFSLCYRLYIIGGIGAGSHVTFYVGLKETSPAFASAMTNLIPSATFILAILFRVEKLKIKQMSSQAKIGGTLVAFAGAAFMAMYKGVSVISVNLPHYTTGNGTSKGALDGNLLKGSIFLLLHCIFTASYYLYQAVLIKEYPAPIALTSLSSVTAAINGAIIAAIIDHKAASWKLPSDIRLLAPIYSGIMIAGVAVYLQIVAIRKKDAVFVASFRPLSTVIAAVMGLFILGVALHLGEILGATLITLGLYVCLWGKEREKKGAMAPAVPDQQPGDTEVGGQNNFTVNA